MRVKEILAENTLDAAKIADIAQHMLNRYRGLRYTARERAVDHAFGYDRNQPQHRYWLAVADEISRLEKNDKGVAEGTDKYGFHTSVSKGKFLPSKYGQDENNLYLHDLMNVSGDGSGPQLVTIDDKRIATEIAAMYGGYVERTGMGTYRVYRPKGMRKSVKQPELTDVAEDTVDEMALASYKTLGDFDKPGSFRGVDKRLVPHPKSEIKAAKFFEQTPYDFRLFFANKPGLGQYQEHGPMTPDQVVKVFGEEDAKKILENHDDAITVVYVSNRGAEKVMMTPWIMAHRFGHAIQAGASKEKWSAWQETEKLFFSTVNRLLDEYYGKVGSVFNFRKADQPYWNLTPEYNALFNAIGTQRSSRTGQIRRPYEFMYELFAQYLGTGTITLNPLPTNLSYGRKVFGNPSKYLNIKPEFRDETERRQISEMLARDMELMFNDVLGNSVGQVYVM